MELKDYLASLTVADRKTFASRCGTSVQHLKNIAAGFRSCAEKLAIEIEKNSAAAVTCEEMRSDVDWAYLRNTTVQDAVASTAA